MIANSPARTPLLQSTVTPQPTATLNKLRPRMEYLSYGMGSVIEQPDGPGEVGRAHFGGWNVPVLSDCVVTNDGTKVVRVTSRRTVDNTDTAIYISVSSDLTSAISFSAPAQTLYPSGAANKQLRDTRGGVAASASWVRYYFINENGALAYLAGNSSGASFSATATVTSATGYGAGTVVAPLSDGNVVIAYQAYNDLRVRIWNGSTIIELGAIAQIPQGTFLSAMNFFDAELYYGSILCVFNTSNQGNSRAFWIYGLGSMTEPVNVLPLDSVDYSTSCKVLGLSLINGVMYATAMQRARNSDGSYTPDILSIVNTIDGFSWGAPDYMVLDVQPVYGKVVAIGQYIALVSHGIVMSGYRPAHMGGSGAGATLDVSKYISEFTSDRGNQMNAGQFQLTLINDDGDLNDDSWLDYAENLVFNVTDGNGNSQTVFNGRVDTVMRIQTVDTDKFSLQGRGPIGQVLDYRQHGVETICDPRQIRMEFDQNTMLNRAGSTWMVNGGYLNLATANDKSEALCMGVVRVDGDFELRTHIMYESVNTRAFGVVFLTGVSADQEATMLAAKDENGNLLYSSEELHDYNYWRVQFIPTALNTVKAQIIRRTSVKVDGAWVSTDTQVGSDVTGIAWSTGISRPLKVQMSRGKLYVWTGVGGVYTARFSGIDTYTYPLPDTSLVGLYAKTWTVKTSGVNNSGDQIIVLESIETGMPTSGSIRVGDETYSYSSIDTSVTPPQLFLASGQAWASYTPAKTVCKVVNAGISVNWFQASDASPRYSVGEVAAKLARRTGVYLAQDSLVGALSTFTEFGDTNNNISYTGGKWVFGSNPAQADGISTGVQVGDFVCEMVCDGMSSSSRIDLIAWGATSNYSGVRIAYTNNRLELFSCSESGGVVTETSLTSEPTLFSMQSAVTLRVIAREGYVHVYANNQFVGSTFVQERFQRFGFLRVRGKSFNLSSFKLDVGHYPVDSIIWESMLDAREILGRILEGREIVVLETTNGTLRLRAVDTHDDLGAVNVSMTRELGPGVNKTDWATAVVVHGGYDWVYMVNPRLIRERGLRIIKVENNTLMHKEALREYAAILLRRQRGAGEIYKFAGRLDCAAEVGDKFTAPLFNGGGGDAYYIMTLGVNYKSTPPVLSMSGQALGLPPATANIYWGTGATVYGTYNSEKEWK